MNLASVPFLRIKSYTLLVALGWSLIVLGLLWVAFLKEEKFIADIARAEARASIDKDLVYRRWNTSHGGVYVPVTETTQPNPYLDVEEREITTPSGRLLTLMNPAYMTRQVYEAGSEQYGFRAHLSSLNPINPMNSPDAWERKILPSFENAVTEVASLEMVNGEEYMRVMLPFITEEGCLKCHAQQGYKVGDVRGGLSISIPMSRYEAIRRAALAGDAMGYGILWLIGWAGINAISRDLKKRIQEREINLVKINQGQDELRASEARYRALFEQAHDAVFILDLNGRHISANQRAADMLGYSLEQMQGLSVDDTSDEVERSREVIHRLLNGEHIPLYERRFKRKDGKAIPVEINVELVRDARGEPLHIQSVVRDISGRKKAEDALRESEERYRALVELAPDAISVHQDGKFLFANPATLALMGAARAGELLGTPVMDRVHPEYRAVVEERIQTVITQGGIVPAIEERLVRFDSAVFDAEVVATAIPYGGQPAVLVIARDITERKRAEKEVREKSAELETLFMLSSHLRAASNAAEMLPLVLKEMARVLGTDANAAILLQPDKTQFVVALGDGLLAQNTGVIFPCEQSISGHVMQTQQPYATLDLAGEPRRSGVALGAEQIGPAMIVPLRSETEFIGTLFCGRAKESAPGPFTPPELQLLTAIGEMVGNALRRARLYDEALSRLQRVQALRSIDLAIAANMDANVTLNVLLNQAIALMNIDAADILVFEPHLLTLKQVAAQGFRARSEYREVRLGEGFAGRAALERKTIWIPNLAAGEESLRESAFREESFRSCCVVPMIAKGQMRGVLEVYNRGERAVGEDWVEFLEAFAMQAAIALDNSQLFNDLQHSNFELTMAYDATIEGWSRAMDLRDKDTAGHTRRVLDWTIAVARLVGIREEQIVHLRRGALLHDIGKMGIPDDILLKPARLSEEEIAIMRQHPQFARDMLYPIEFLRPAIDIPFCHHEKWDGTGYPRGLKGELIPLAARIFAVVDVWDALTSNRPYRTAWTHEQTLAYIQEQSGKHFDPQIVELFIQVSNRSAQDDFSM